MNSSLVLALLVVTAPSWAQQAPLSATAARSSADSSTGSSTSASPPDSPRTNEPNVKLSVVEDEGSKIEELRVRGQIQRIVVTPKVGLKKSYEIITGDPSHLPADGTGGAPDAIGKRVWNVLNF